MTVDYRREADKAAKRYGISPTLFRALIQQESGWNPTAGSGAGAIGLTQLMPATARGLGVDPRDPIQNLRGGAKYLRQQLDTFGGNTSKALAAYNAGPGAVQKYGGTPPYAETQNYVKTILAAAGKGSGKTGRVAGSSRATPAVPAPVDVAAPEASSPLPEAGSNGAAILASLLTQPRQAASSQLQAPAASARPQFAGAIPMSGGGPAPRADISALLEAAQTQGGSVPMPAAPTGTDAVPVTASAPAPKASGGGSGFKGSGVKELFWQGQGGVNIKDGRSVAQGFVSGHTDHVHVAAGPKTVDRLGRLAQNMGLRVGENDSFGGVDRGAHVQGSNHYRDMAIDVSGDPKKMAAYARRVAAYNRTHRL